MAPPVFKPENIIKRAEELILVGQSQAALQSLHELIISKRNRSTQALLEVIVLRYVSLVVELRNGRMAREALTQYRNLCQHSTTNISSLELVVQKFIEEAEAKVEAEKLKEAKAEPAKLGPSLAGDGTGAHVDVSPKLALSGIGVEDLEEVESPESVVYKSLLDDSTALGRTPVSGGSVSSSGDAGGGVSELMSWLRFLWEAYRIALELIRNNEKLEAQYKATCQKAFEFCVKYERRLEFKRLCEMMRSHLAIILKSTPGPSAAHHGHHHLPFYLQYSIQMTVHGDSWVTQLELRLTQLKTSMKLGLWQEAFKSIEDIYGLLSLHKNTPALAGFIKRDWMIVYYEALVQIFKMANATSTAGIYRDLMMRHANVNARLFHAAALHKLIGFVRSPSVATGSTSEDDGNKEAHTLTKMACEALVSALIIPPTQSISPFGPNTTRDAFGDYAEGMMNDSLASSSAHATSFLSIKDVKLSQLLGLAKIPTREGLMRDAMGSQYLPHVSQELKDLYGLLEAEPFAEHGAARPDWATTLACKYAAMKEKLIASNVLDFAFYEPGIQQVLLYRFFDALSRGKGVQQLKDTKRGGLRYSFDQLMQWTRGLFYDWYECESFLLSAHDRWDVLIDHATQTVCFVTAHAKDALVTNGSSAAPLKEMAEKLKSLFESVSSQLAHHHVSMAPPLVPDVASLETRMEAEHMKLLKRREVIEKRKEAQEMASLKREREEAAERAARQQKEAEAESKRREEEKNKRETEAHAKRLAELEKQERLKTAVSISSRLAVVGKKVDIESLAQLDQKEMLARQAKELLSGQQEIEKKLAGIAKKWDHLERAIRTEESKAAHPALAEAQKMRDRDIFTFLEGSRLKQAKMAYEAQKRCIESAQRIRPFAEADVRASWKAAQRKELAILGQEHAATLASAKAARKQAVLAARAQEAEERTAKALEETHQEKKRQEAEELHLKLETQTRIQKAKEAEIEAKLEAAKHGVSVADAGPGMSAPTQGVGSGKFVPSWKKTQSGPAAEGTPLSPSGEAKSDPPTSAAATTTSSWRKS